MNPDRESSSGVASVPNGAPITELAPQKATTTTLWRLPVLLASGVLAFIVLAVGACFGLACTQITSRFLPSPTPFAQAVLKHPLADVTLPSQPTAYPANWPAELRFPSQLTVVEASSGILPDGTSRAWIAKLRYSGTPKDAAGAMMAYLSAHGWQVTQDDLGGAGYLLSLTRNSAASTGSVTVAQDASAANVSDLLVTIRL